MNNNYNGQPMGPSPMPNPNFQQQPTNQPNMMGAASKPKMSFPTDKMSLLGFAGAAIMAVGAFLDFAKLTVTMNRSEFYSASVNYFSAEGQVKDGALILGLAIVVAILIFFRKNLISLIPAAIAAIIVVIDVSDTLSKLNELKDQYLSYTTSYGVDVKCSFGLAIYFVAIGIVLVVIHAIMKFKEKKKNAQPTNNSMTYQQPIPQPMNYGMPNPNATVNNPQYPDPNQSANQGPNNMM